jgi:hypothetical protein
MTAPEGLEALRVPFPKSAIGKLPKGNVMLDYVGHAAVTDRLLSVDPGWNWEPLAYDDRGFPARDPEGALWIRLTVCGVTRLGVSDPKDTNKVAIGDAIRNAAMRFGVALDLWTKDDLESQAGTDATRRREIVQQPRGPLTGPPQTPGEHGHADALAELHRIIGGWPKDGWQRAHMAELRESKGWPRSLGEYSRSQVYEARAAARSLNEEPWPVDPAEVSGEVLPGAMPVQPPTLPVGGLGAEQTDEPGDGPSGSVGGPHPAPVDNPDGSKPARTRGAKR